VRRLQLSHRHLPDKVTVIAVVGEVDVGSSEQLHAYLEQARRTPDEQLVFDLTEMPLIDSNGIQVLVNAHTYARTHGTTIRVANLQPKAIRVFDIVQLDTYIPVHATLEDALHVALTSEPPSDHGTDSGTAPGTPA
jgi:anti-sigma B factor antagonist